LTEEFTVVSLFSGAGGLDLGFKLTGEAVAKVLEELA